MAAFRLQHVGSAEDTGRWRAQRCMQFTLMICRGERGNTRHACSLECRVKYTRMSETMCPVQCPTIDLTSMEPSCGQCVTSRVGLVAFLPCADLQRERVGKKGAEEKIRW